MQLSQLILGNMMISTVKNVVELLVCILIGGNLAGSAAKFCVEVFDAGELISLW